MTAPDEFSRNRNTVSGTAVSTTAFIRSAAPGMPITSNALTYGDSPSFVEFHGRITASRKTDPTEKIKIRTITEFVALAIARAGSCDSAAAIVAISAPTIEKITTTIDEKITPGPFGRNPPCAVRFEKSASRPGQSPSTKQAPRASIAQIANTLMPANRYSNSPYERAQRLPRVVGEAPGRRVGRRHLAEHPHDQHDQDAGGRVGQERGRADVVDHRAGSDEQPGAYHAADRDHPEVSRTQSLMELGHPARWPERTCSIRRCGTPGG
nr:hypothetical protein [Cryptosporangium phraense]